MFKDWASEIAKIKAVPYPMNVDVVAGDVKLFAEAIDREVGLHVPDRDEKTLSLCGIPIRKSDLLPANMADGLVASHGQMARSGNDWAV
jgi:hypothetical protein